MGISLPAAKLLIELSPKEAFAGRVLQLGRQDIAFSEDSLKAAAEAGGFPLIQRGAASFDDQGFFGSLGFEHIDSLDASDFEGASILFDLNDPEVPEALSGCFDMVFDGGTIEHIFHVPNALKSVAAMLKVGGVVVHSSPVHNYFEHGFYCFNPTLLHDFYGQNGFEILASHLLRFSADSANRCESTDLLQGNVSGLCRAGALDNRCYAIFFAARKTQASQAAVIPQQSAYLKAWAGEEARERGGNSTFMRLLRKLAKRDRRLFALYSAMKTQAQIRSVRWRRI